MILRSKMLLVPLLALSMGCGAAATARAATDVSLQINFGSTPHWVGVPGTQVREIRRQDRSDYDVFQYGRRYYAYNYRNTRWYISRRGRGRFTMIDTRSVPRELRRIPRDHWRNYPTAWEDSRPGGSNGSGLYLQVNFGSAPRWSSINGTNVSMVYGDARPNYDVFRYGGNYYAYSGDRWYSSSRESGRFNVIEASAVPSEFSRVPREQWRNYPPAWGNRNNNSPGNGNGNGNGRGNGKGNNGRGGRGGN